MIRGCRGPEEYRTAIDCDADLLFAPTETAAANLRAEAVQGDIFVTGNTGIDALLDAERRLPSPSVRDGGALRILVTCHRRESWAAGLEAIATALSNLAEETRTHIDVILHPNSFVAATMLKLLGGSRSIALLPPCSHPELLARMRDADLIMSDSGGIQEEAPALGVPLLILRDKTERPEGITTGASKLVGTDTSRILAEARRLLDDPVARAEMSRRRFPFGGGHAAPRIAAIIASWLEQRSLTRRLA
jgi:UDP-N-acetylglucosamine 2-epimerase (non-hydrolysing)